ncbi:beta-L-arabinofuranosidase domain-containing protein [Clostridium estertheticum]|uniref:beta-L-arabinofuranosidase domain-containing protein n=1 Tax=Clostridium estertheticum TaxID=238834 RepID=UPI00209B307F|nr:beta-L-arabinofuranosidase domain-containing protein [Clostridium estertheticum]
MIKSFSMSQVQLTNPYLTNAFVKEIEYLKSFNSDKLLSFFRITKDLTPKAKSYPGWENSEIRGHTLGHYLSALAQVYATTNDITIYGRIQYILDELSLCQLDNGYLSAFPEEFFNKVENAKPVWVPWYTMHKIITGLNTVYELTKMEIAFKIVSRLGDWVYNRTYKWTPEIQAKVLSVEYGGMNDCMYELFKITKDEKHRYAAHKFDELSLFTQIHDGKDILNNRHANTTIPKFLGALNRYFIYGESEQFYLDACKQFWDIVVTDHSYVTGGNSEWEHFGQPKILDAERTATNCETCNTYNMLKLSKGLFQITGDKKYSDFYENTFINAILSSQNPDTGMTMYFQPMATGYFKVYSKPFEHFWCCTGTGMENFSKLNDSLYFYEGNKLFVNMYLSSSLNWTEKQIMLLQDTDIPNTDSAYFKINAKNNIELTLCFRIPSWSKGASIKINNELTLFEEEKGYALINRIWKNNDTIEIDFKIEVSFSSLPDNSNAIAFTYGPLVLSAALGTEKLEESTTGVNVSIPSRHVEIKDYIIIKSECMDSFKNHITENLIKTQGKMEFRLKGTDEDTRLIFTPHYLQHTQRYGIYWILVEENSKELKKYILEKQQSEKVKAAEIDSIQIGNDQYELSHHVLSQDTEAGDRDGFHYRFAKNNGWFSYEMKVSHDENTYLQFRYLPMDCRKSFDVYINDSQISHEVIGNKTSYELTEKTYLIPKEIYGNNNTVTVKFKAEAQDITGRIVDLIRTTKNI